MVIHSSAIPRKQASSIPDGPHLLWGISSNGDMNPSTNMLTRDGGVEFVPAGGTLSLDQVMVGIVTALPEENAAVCEVLGCRQEAVAKRDGGNKVYHLGMVWHRSSQRGIVVAVAQLINMGNVASAVRATNLLTDCPNLKEIIVYGIAGGVPTPTRTGDHVRVGDIVSGTEGVLQYDFGKEIPNRFEIKGGPFPPSPSLSLTAKALNARFHFRDPPGFKEGNH